MVVTPRFNNIDYAGSIAKGNQNALSQAGIMNLGQQMGRRNALAPGEMQQQQLKTDTDRQSYMLKLLSTTTDQASWTAAKQDLISKGMPPQTLPDQWDPNLKAHLLNVGQQKLKESYGPMGEIPGAPGMIGQRGSSGKYANIINPGGKHAAAGWKFMRSQDGANVYRINPNQGAIQKRTPEGWVDDPTANLGKLQRIGNQGSFGSSMNQRFVNRVAGAANEGIAALISVAGMSNPSSGLFSSAASGGGPNKNIVAALMTPEGVKRYNATIAGLAPEIAAAQSQGMRPSAGQIPAIEEAISIGPTDNLQTKQYRIALAARYLRNALEVSNDLANPKQLESGKKLLKRLELFPDPDSLIGNDWEKGVFSGTAPAPAQLQPPAAQQPMGQQPMGQQRMGQPPEQVIQEGQTATNPQTGQMIIFRGGQWQPL